jgi:hypothetical protein
MAFNGFFTQKLHRHIPEEDEAKLLLQMGRYCGRTAKELTTAITHLLMLMPMRRKG